MSGPAADEPFVARLLARLDRPGMVDVGRIGRDRDRIASPGLGLADSATVRRLAARGSEAATPTVGGAFTHLSGASGAADEGAGGEAALAPASSTAVATPSGSTIRATVSAAASRAAATAPPRPGDSLAQAGGAPGDLSPTVTILADAVEAVASPDLASPSQGRATPSLPELIGARPPTTRFAIQAGAPAEPGLDLAPDPGAALVTARSAAVAAPAGAGPGLAAGEPAPAPPAAAGPIAPASRLSGARPPSPMIGPATTPGRQPSPGVEELSDLVARDLRRRLQVEHERQGGARWKR